MSQTRYIEFDSSYRNRELYPLPSNFTVEMSQSGQGTRFSARDPESDSSPVLIWNNSFVENGSASYPASSIVAITVNPTPSPNTYQITTTSNNYFVQVRNFYVGTAIQIGTVPYSTRQIIDYQPINLNTAIIVTSCPISDSFVGESTFFIVNPTPINTTTVNSVIKVFVPGSNQNLSTTEQTQTYGLGGDNFYVNYYIQDDTGNSQLITAFDSATRLATLAGLTTINWATAGINFSIRKVLPQEFGQSILYATANAVQLADIANPYNVQTGDFIRISVTPTSPSPYNIAVHPPFNASVVGSNPQTQERRVQQYITGSGILSSVFGTTVNLGSTASTVDGYYIGAILTDLSRASGGPPAFPFLSETIIAYNGATQQATLSSAIPGATAGDSWFIRTAILSSPFVPIPVVGNVYEIEPFTKDNYSPFVYTGSIVSSQEVVCYEVELINLILPNTILSSGRGGRPIFYPYLYVELQQLSTSSSAGKNLIYSNNPNSSKILFRAIVDDNVVPVISPFIKIDSDGMVQTVKFKPNESFKFAVYHSDGSPFTTVIQDFYSPTMPNPLCQISACFAFKRV